ncbi:MAG: hypothetical protein J1F12_08935, partial [Muribaculaceae bacterium]|nr:hypothetical protein [Muribaculaceae bacterium]
VDVRLIGLSESGAPLQHSGFHRQVCHNFIVSSLDSEHGDPGLSQYNLYGVGMWKDFQSYTVQEYEGCRPLLDWCNVR